MELLIIIFSYKKNTKILNINISSQQKGRLRLVSTLLYLHFEYNRGINITRLVKKPSKQFPHLITVRNVHYFRQFFLD